MDCYYLLPIEVQYIWNKVYNRWVKHKIWKVSCSVEFNTKMITTKPTSAINEDSSQTITIYHWLYYRRGPEPKPCIMWPNWLPGGGSWGYFLKYFYIMWYGSSILLSHITLHVKLVWFSLHINWNHKTKFSSLNTCTLWLKIIFVTWQLCSNC